jgi:hypothetical protein
MSFHEQPRFHQQMRSMVGRLSWDSSSSRFQYFGNAEMTKIPLENQIDAQ